MGNEVIPSDAFVTIHRSDCMLEPTKCRLFPIQWRRQITLQDIYTPPYAACRRPAGPSSCRGAGAADHATSYVHKYTNGEATSNQHPAPSTPSARSWERPSFGAYLPAYVDTIIQRRKAMGGVRTSQRQRCPTINSMYQLIKGSMLERYLPHSSISPALDRVQANNGSRHAVSNVYY